ncbi:MAG: hypothetical protein N2445_03885 [Acidobacteria bacterium]|nr:hypothetical protein [Acidobacteriota bacterium]
METYRIPKEKRTVLLRVPPAPPDEKTLFLSPFADSHQGRETLSDLLMKKDKFLPVLESNNSLLLVRKSSIQWIEILQPEETEWYYMEMRVGTPRAKILVEFTTGDTMEGFIHALTPEGDRRVSDVVNLSEGFLHLESREGLYLINLEKVSTIRIIEEESA